MRVAALYDIHANFPALEAVLDDVRHAKVDQIVMGGDVLPGPMPSETIACLLDLDIPVQFIQGNGDREVLAAMHGGETKTLPEQALESIRWNAQQLSLEHLRVIAGWPQTLRMNLPRFGEVLFCHATPRSDTEIFTRLTPTDRLVPIFATVAARIVVCGHTHMQFDRMIGSTRVLNAGSVGMPFAEPGAYWLLFDTDIELRRTHYDLAAGASRIRASHYPQAQHFAARHVLQPPSEAEMLAAFSNVEITK